MGFIPEVQEFFITQISITLIHHINKVMNKKHMTISVDTEKAFDKIQYPFMIKKNPLKKVSIERANLNILKALYDKLTANIMLHGKS